MADLACPVCGAVGEPKVQIRNIAICGTCGASLVVRDDGSALRATAVDTSGLDALELHQLVRARASIARPERR